MCTVVTISTGLTTVYHKAPSDSSQEGFVMLGIRNKQTKEKIELISRLKELLWSYSKVSYHEMIFLGADFLLHVEKVLHKSIMYHL